MRFLGTSSNSISSKLIEWGLEEDISHFAIRFGDLVVDSDFQGFDVDIYERWAKGRQIKYDLEPKQFISYQDENDILRFTLREYAGDDYDKSAVAYFALRAIQRRLFNRPLPKRNPWNTSNPICVEIARVIQISFPHFFNTSSQSKLDFGIMTPKGLIDNMYSTGNFILRSP